MIASGGRDPLALQHELTGKPPDPVLDNFLYLGGVRAVKFVSQLGFDQFTHVVSELGCCDEDGY